MRSPYEQGFIDGLTAYAISKDGQQVIGNDRPLKECIEKVRDTWNFDAGADGEHQRMLAAICAMYAWFYAEDKMKAGHNARQELCNYTQYLTDGVINGDASEYKGVPHLYLGEGLVRATEDDCLRLIDEFFAEANKFRADAWDRYEATHA